MNKSFSSVLYLKPLASLQPASVSVPAVTMRGGQMAKNLKWGRAIKKKSIIPARVNDDNPGHRIF